MLKYDSEKFDMNRIDWRVVEGITGINACGDPEAIVHELAHVIDARGKPALANYIGDQSEVDTIIFNAFHTKNAAELSEIRTSAITYLVVNRILPHGYNNLKTIVVNSMVMNLRDWDPVVAEEEFGRALE